MDTTAVHTPTAHETPEAQALLPLPFSPPARFCLVPVGSVPTRIDGAWWPRSRDLTAELPALIAGLERRWNRITRITVNPAHWPVIPRKVQVNGHVVRVSWFKAKQDPHELTLLSYRTGRWDLLVIPPRTSAATATWLMTAATDPLRASTGSHLMEEAFRRAADEAAGADEAAEALESVWDSEGGNTRPTVLHGP